jgi:two-component system, OmpR family, phosphate regulon sensor histidine kinase PhoR
VRNRIFLKAMGAFVAVIAAATLTLDISIRHTWENALRTDIERILAQNAQGFALRVQNDQQHSLQQMATEEARITETRVTIIARDGVVLADSEADPKTMENHAGRPEVVDALGGKIGSSTRLSHTVGVEFLYLAVPSGDKIVRLAYPLSSIRQHIADIRSNLMRATILALLMALVLSVVIAEVISRRLRRIVRFAEQVAAGDLSARIAETSGDEIAQVAVALDRTARRLEENFAAIRDSRSELEALLNSMTDGVIAVSPDMTVRWANHAIGSIIHQQVRIGVPVIELLRHPDFLATLTAALKSKHRETTIAASLSGRRSFSINAEPLPDGGVVSVLHDISEVERVEKTRRDFIANVSHELRTPLTSISGYTETLIESDGLLNDSAREFLQVIRRNADRMGRLTEDLLVLARVESGEEKLDLRPHSARELLAESASSMLENARAAEVEITVEDIPDWSVVADGYAVHQVFGNLISNAIRYAQSGKKIIIGAAERNGGIEFFVRDFGPGIASEHLPRIFERFYRVDKARSRESGGTGLGLAIVKHIVLNHGGAVRVESTVGHGTTFFFLLPKA